jgi:C4-dicarboxylate-specific signal transduction histidine kinase
MHPPRLAVLADPSQIEQVLVNLLANAIDAMAGDPAVRHCARWPARALRGRCVLIRQRQRPGIAPEMRRAAVRALCHQQAAGRRAGPGLMISRRIVRAFGGDARADQNAGGGATFRMTLPLRCAGHPPARIP